MVTLGNHMLAARMRVAQAQDARGMPGHVQYVTV
jgi:hypothetical protein